MNIEKYIKKCLIEYKFVSIEGIGTIKHTAIPATTISKKNNTYHLVPPSVELKLVNDNPTNAQLIEFISNYENISTDEIKSSIDNYAEKVVQKLKDQGTYSVANIGEFTLNSRQFVQFNSKVESPFLSKNLQYPDIIVEKNIHTEKQKNKKISPLLLGAVIAAILAVSVFIILYSGIFQTNIQTDTAKKTGYATDTIKKTKKNDNGKKNVISNGGKYYIVVGSFNNRFNAEKLLKQLRKKEYDPKILETESGMFRVSLNVYKTEEEANTALEELMKTDKDVQVWVYSEQD